MSTYLISKEIDNYFNNAEPIEQQERKNIFRRCLECLNNVDKKGYLNPPEERERNLCKVCSFADKDHWIFLSAFED